MKINDLNKMTRGWYIGDFEPAAHKSKSFEVGIKKFSAGEIEAPHIHHVITEITCVIEGIIEMNGVQYGPGKIITLEPNEECYFKSLTDSTIVVVKNPSLPNDKELIKGLK